MIKRAAGETKIERGRKRVTGKRVLWDRVWSIVIMVKLKKKGLVIIHQMCAYVVPCTKIKVLAQATRHMPYLGWPTDRGRGSRPGAFTP